MDNYFRSVVNDTITHELATDSRYVIIEQHNGLVREYRVEFDGKLSGIFLSFERAQRHVHAVIQLRQQQSRKSTSKRTQHA